MGNLLPADAEYIKTNGVLKQIPKGTVLLQEGKIGKNCWFIEKGYIRAVQDKDGKEININFWFEDEFAVNYSSQCYGKPSDYNLVAGEDLEVWEFEDTFLKSLFDKAQRFETFGRKLLEQMVMNQEQHLTLFKMNTPMERYQYIESEKPELLQRISLTMLSSYLGMSRETLSRIRKR